MNLQLSPVLAYWASEEPGSLVGNQVAFFADHPPLSPGGRLCHTPSDRVSVKRIAPQAVADRANRPEGTRRDLPELALVKSASRANLPGS